MGGSRRWIPILLSIFGCTVSRPTLRPFTVPQLMEGEEITALAFDPTGSSLLISRRNGPRCLLERLNVAAHTVNDSRELPFCPDHLVVNPDGTTVASSATASLIFDASGAVIPNSGHVLAFASAGNLLVEEAGRLFWKKGGERFPIGRGIRSPRILARSEAVIAIQRSDRGESLVRISSDQIRSLTGDFRAIDSFDVSPGEEEIVISADGGKGFDVGLLSSDSGEIRWVFPDALPERLVTWAPRGNKVSYVVAMATGALIRTVHVPTSFQLTVDFPLSAISAVVWEPKAEKFAALSSSPTHGQRIELLRYNGDEREVLWTNNLALGGEVDHAADSVILSPPVKRYAQQYPVVVWVTNKNPLAWNAFRALVHADGSIGTVITSSSALSRLLNDLAALPWADTRRIFVVYSEDSPNAAAASGVTTFLPDRRLRDHYEIRRNGHTIVSVPVRPAAEIEAFAADYIRQELVRE